MTDNEAYKITVAQQMASSCAGSLLVSVFMTPLDVVKIRLQTQERYFSKKCFLYSNGITDHLLPRVNGDLKPVAPHTPEEICNCKWYNRPKYFNGTFDAFIKISKVEGITSLWSGLSPTLVLAVPTTVIYFTTYEQLKKRLGAHLGYSGTTPDPPWLAMGSGVFARIWAVSIVSPLELIRTKMQSQKMRFYQVQQALKITIESQGIRGLWRGYSATLLRDVPFSGIYWPCYELLKPNRYNFPETFLAGAVSGTVASTITLPMDVIKTRFQIELGEKMLTSSTTKSISRSNLSVALEIIGTEGISGLFTGLVPRILKVAPACAIMIASYEYCKKFFVDRNLRSKKN